MKNRGSIDAPSGAGLLPPPTVEKTIKVDPFDVDAVAWARELRDWLVAIMRGQQERRAGNESQDRIGAATIAKLADSALKCERYAAERHDKIAEREHDQMLIDHELKMTELGRRGPG